jgi:hypothetical protein
MQPRYGNRKLTKPIPDTRSEIAAHHFHIHFGTGEKGQQDGT